MNKFYSKLWLTVAMLGIMCPAFSQQYRIQLCAFTEEISPTYFDFAGFNEVDITTNAFKFHKYLWGNFTSLKDAQLKLLSLQEQTPKHGFSNLKIVSALTADKNSSIANIANQALEQRTEFQLFSRSIKFNAGKHSLQKSEVEQLEELTHLLKTNPELKLRVIAPKGRIAKNGKRSIPANIIRNFLLAKEIPAYRIKTIEQELQRNLATTNTKPLPSPPIIMTLVDLKEEIILDRFGHNGMIVKQLPDPQLNNVLE